MQDFFAIQLHPDLKVAGGKKTYKFFIENPEETSEGSIQKITWRTAIQNAVLGLSDSQLKRLSTAQVYGKSMLNKPTHSTSKAMRGYMAGLLNNDTGYQLVERALRNLKEVEDIDLLISGLSSNKIIVSETNIKRNDNVTLATLTNPMHGSVEDKAMQIYDMFKDNPQWKKDIIEWLLEDVNKTPAASKRGRMSVTATEKSTEETTTD